MVHSLYQYNIPQGLIGLHTPYGQKMLGETTIINRNYVLREMKQIHLTYCGPASLAFFINTIHAMSHVKLTEKMINENDIVSAEKNGIKDYFQQSNINKTGMTIANLSHVAMLLGFGVHSYYALDEKMTEKNNYDKLKLNAMLKEKEWEVSVVKNEHKLRELIKDNIKRPVTGIIANFNMSQLGYNVNFGHFSPIAAYHKNEDMFLVMDVWPFTPPAWIKTSLLFQAIATIDSDSNLPRGFLRVNVLL